MREQLLKLISEWRDENRLHKRSDSAHEAWAFNFAARELDAILAANPEPVVDHERKRFEAWISSPPYERSIERFEDWERHAGQYRHYQVELCWQAWLAAVGDAKTDTNSQQN